ncbi:O-antigen/teichoic acid export membrane protein [Dysgonomonadaceae bacterium PH5-43]|nr:O-antigen/teichoic acid export membrane protein [Dysgonomonadaceae bacterium PH5-43]
MAQEDNIGSNKRIAKNTMFLYFRMLFTMGIGLYTSRLLLDTLGVSDYGLYSIVGGVVLMFAFLQSALSGATVRFLNVAMTEDDDALSKVFNTSLIIHLILCAVVFILSETVGLWLVYNKLEIPDGRFNAALITYQISIVSVLISIYQIPYNSAIIAHERMKVFAYISIIEAALKLAVVFVVIFVDFDKLILYAVLILLATTIIRIIYQVYCVRNFKECKVNWKYDKDIMKNMLSFFGWDTYGNFSVTIKEQGIKVLHNMFFGTVINAASAVAAQAMAGVSSLTGNFVMAIRPQLMKSYAKNDFSRMNVLTNQGTRLSYFLFLMIAIPLFFEADFFLNLWLKEVPDKVVVFLRISICASLVSLLFSLLIALIHATGRVVEISFITGSIYLLNVPVVYLLFKLGCDAEYAYYATFVTALIAGISNLLITRKNIPMFDVFMYLKTIATCLITLVVSCALVVVMMHYIFIENALIRVIIIFLITVIFSFIIGVNKTEKQMILQTLKTKLKAKN